MNENDEQCSHENWHVIECDGETDTCQCCKCGFVWEERCSFDDDMS